VKYCPWCGCVLRVIKRVGEPLPVDVDGIGADLKVRVEAECDHCGLGFDWRETAHVRKVGVRQW